VLSKKFGESGHSGKLKKGERRNKALKSGTDIPKKGGYNVLAKHTKKCSKEATPNLKKTSPTPVSCYERGGSKKGSLDAEGGGRNQGQSKKMRERSGGEVS